jgi:hypothetical protein
MRATGKNCLRDEYVFAPNRASTPNCPFHAARQDIDVPKWKLACSSDASKISAQTEFGIFLAAATTSYRRTATADSETPSRSSGGRLKHKPFEAAGANNADGGRSIILAGPGAGMLA